MSDRFGSSPWQKSHEPSHLDPVLKTSPDFTDLWEQFVVQLIEPDGGHEQA